MVEKKKLLLIGNKPLSEDYSNIINDYDMVVRVNRMLNFDNSTGKTDLWLAGIHDTAIPLYEKEDKQKYRDAKRIILHDHQETFARQYLKELGANGEITVEDYNQHGVIKKYIPSYCHHIVGLWVTNTIWMLIYCLEHFSNEYEIHTLGIGDRNFLNNPIHNYHNRIYKSEQFFLENLILDKKIKMLDPDFIPFRFVRKDHTKYYKRIPSVSSFWHNENDNLPRFVVASINSFTENGCPYYLYTYKDYNNMPEGVILKDANEIVPSSELFKRDNKEFASFADYFRIKLFANGIDTAWTDTDNFFIRDDFDKPNVLILQDGRIQNSFVYLGDNEVGNKFKELLIEFYEDPQKIREYDNAEMKYRKEQIQQYSDKITSLKYAVWGIGGSTLYTNTAQAIGLTKQDGVYDYYRYFNNFRFNEQFELWDYEDQDYMHYRNNDVKILVLSMNLLQRDKNVLINHIPTSYVGKLIDRYAPKQ